MAENGMMKSAIFLGKQSVEIREVPIPVCGPKDVLIRNRRSSVCGTDAAVYRTGPDGSHRITVGGEFGHETVSEVAAVGSEVKPEDFRVGERVYPYPLLARKDPSRAGTLGAFSEYILVPDAEPERSLYRVPDSIPDDVACMIEPFTVGTRAARRSLPREGEKAIVFGAGTIGIAAAVALRTFGVGMVAVCDLSEKRLAIAKALGLETLPAKEAALLPRAKALFGTAPSLSGETADVDIFLDAAGADSVYRFFAEHGKIESRFVEVAVGNRKREVDFVDLSFAQKSLVGSGGYAPEDVRDVLKIQASGKWNLSSLCTQTYPLDELAEALETAGRPEESLNVQITF
ncbi:MAG: zinc-binding dehydrogenase [Lachnospiraceae bacterium]